MRQRLPNNGRVFFKTSAGVVLTSCRAAWGPLTSDYYGAEVDVLNIKNTAIFICQFSQIKLATKLVKQSHFVFSNGQSWYITGLKDYGSHTEIVGLLQAVPVAFQVSIGGGIISEYEFRSSSGLITDEKSLNTLTNVNSVTYNASVPGHLSSEVGSAVFNGTTNYLNIADVSQTQLDIAGSMTVALWLKITNHTGTQGIIAKANAAPNRGYYLYKNGSGNILLELSNDGTAAITAQGGTILPLNTWVSVAAVFNGSIITLYVNGVVDTATNNPIAKTTGIYNNAELFCLGCRSDAAQFYNGSMANVFVCNQSKTADEILLWHQTGVMP